MRIEQTVEHPMLMAGGQARGKPSQQLGNLRGCHCTLRGHPIRQKIPQRERPDEVVEAVRRVGIDEGKAGGIGRKSGECTNELPGLLRLQ